MSRSNISKFADQFRPSPKPVFEAEEIKLPPPRPEFSFWSARSLPQDIVDQYQKSAVYEWKQSWKGKHRKNRTPINRRTPRQTHGRSTTVEIERRES
jgi:hypothetical protein